MIREWLGSFAFSGFWGLRAWGFEDVGFEPCVFMIGLENFTSEGGAGTRTELPSWKAKCAHPGITWVVL